MNICDVVDTHHKTPRLAVRAILSTDSAGFVLWLGVLCSTWSVVSRGSTLRTWLDPHGDLSRECVVVGNIMVARWANDLKPRVSMLIVKHPKIEPLIFRQKMGTQLTCFRTCCVCKVQFIGLRSFFGSISNFYENLTNPNWFDCIPCLFPTNLYRD